jgi:endonuclease/exonuclease/phosphatase family metal-dependent hydrolase
LAPVSLRVLTWNLMHGRSVPSAGRDLLDDFAEAMRDWDWDLALLQEVPPWWPGLLATRLGGEHRVVLTSRNAALPLRRAIAVRRPDLIRSSGGGSNAILVREGQIQEHHTRLLRRFPERRRLQAVRLAGGTWVGNLHATVHNDAAARDEARLAAETMLTWADGAPTVLGGDFNVRGLALDGFTLAGVHDVDHVFVAGLSPVFGPEVLQRGPLSDHAPVLVTVG